MWRFAMLSFSILFFTAVSVKADRLTLKVSSGHHGGGHRGDHGHGGFHQGYHHGYYRHGGYGHGGFAYRHYWHHEGWGHVYLEPQYTVYLGPQPYNGPGYQIVTVYFDDGSRLDNVYVYNHDQIELPSAYSNRRIVKLVVTN